MGKAGVVLVVLFLFSMAVAQSGAGQNQTGITGEWLVTRDVYGDPLYQRMTLKQEGGKVTGVFAGR